MRISTGHSVRRSEKKQFFQEKQTSQEQIHPDKNTRRDAEILVHAAGGFL
jgi:hypothetical protein